MIVAIDGPAAAGKGTLARMLAKHYGWAYLDTGALYRAVGRRVLRTGGDPTDEAAAATAARSLDPTDLKDPELRTEETAQAASKVAELQTVRTALLKFQRNFAEYPPGGKNGVVVDGRDIGSVVLPNAQVKFYVTASTEERARRRAAELAKGPGKAPDALAVAKKMIVRDQRDAERKLSPMLPAHGAYLLDTTDLDIDAAFAVAKAYISGRF